MAVSAAKRADNSAKTIQGAISQWLIVDG
jgi:hypothetical protein